MPGMRRGGRLLAPAGRRGLPVRPLAGALRRRPSSPLPRLDALLDEVARSWPALAERSPRLPSAPPPLTALTVQRSAGWFVFVFAGGRYPVLLLKPGHPGGETDREERILDIVAPVGIAPRLLPSVAGRSVQEGLPGLPLWVHAPGDPGWSSTYVSAFDALGAALVTVTEATAVRAGYPHDEHLALAEAHVESATTANLVRAARRDIQNLDAGSLQHWDMSAQNWLVDGDDLVGLIDWETGDPRGAIGHDALQTAVSLLENGVGLRPWSEDNVVREFARAWHDEPLFERARSWNRQCVIAATGSDRLVEPLVTAFFAERLGSCLAGDGPSTLTAPALAAMLDIVSGS